MPIVNLTKEFISTKLTCPPGKRKIEYVSDDRSGLYISVTASNQNSGTFYLRYRSPNNDKTSHIKLGRTSDKSFEETKTKVTEYRTQIAKGIDPRDSIKDDNPYPCSALSGRSNSCHMQSYINALGFVTKAYITYI